MQPDSDAPIRRRSTYRPPSSTTPADERPAAPVTDPAPAPADVPTDLPLGTDPTRARHRAERRGNRRATSGLARQVGALTGIASMLGVCVLGAVGAVGGDATAATRAVAISADPTPGSAGDTITAAVRSGEITQAPAITSGLSSTQTPFTGGAQVSVEGEHLDAVAAVTVGGVPAVFTAVNPAYLVFDVPATASTAQGTSAAVEFLDAAGQPVGTRAPASSRPAATVDAEASVASFQTTPTQLALTYTSDPRIDAQVNYVLAYWQNYNSGQYLVISGNDCANFTSQSLLQRGWAMDGAWSYDFATGQASAAWTSSTAMRDWLLSRPDLATPLEDAQRDQVKVGDVAQFDWDNSGDRDHTTVVTRVEHTGSGTKVWVGGHTKDADFWDVDQALSGGGSVHYFSLR
ncbi:amidase domain-containing protein [Agromyces sp. MMS24-K17]|uniref:amidase domain-containing protein n=1 Tax=Agromyces sp. MMS24-K17 TaxID=3372850 RepID=UPI0037548DF3